MVSYPSRPQSSGLHPTSPIKGANDQCVSTTSPATFLVTAVQTPKHSSIQITQRKKPGIERTWVVRYTTEAQLPQPSHSHSTASILHPLPAPRSQRFESQSWPNSRERTERREKAQAIDNSSKRRQRHPSPARARPRIPARRRCGRGCWRSW